jgi:hypothetical protein
MDPRLRMPRMRAGIENDQLALRWEQAGGQALVLESAPHPAGPWSILHSYPSGESDAGQVFHDPHWQSHSPARFYRLRPQGE